MRGYENRDGSRASGIGSGGTKALGFWTKVCKRPDGCWDWLGYLYRNGAGKYTAHKDGKQFSVRAAKYAHEQLVGPIPPGHALLAVVCWNRRCVNPAHRMPVPHRDIVRWINALERPIERADNRGEMCARAILTEEAVHFIRAQSQVRGSMPLLAQLYGVSVVTIGGVKYGRSWKHIRRRQADTEQILSLRQLRELVRQRGLTADLDELASARPGAAA